MRKQSLGKLISHIEEIGFYWEENGHYKKGRCAIDETNLQPLDGLPVMRFLKRPEADYLTDADYLEVTYIDPFYVAIKVQK